MLHTLLYASIKELMLEIEEFWCLMLKTPTVQVKCMKELSYVIIKYCFVKLHLLVFLFVIILYFKEFTLFSR